MRQTSWEGEAGTEWQTGLGRAGQRRTRGQLDRPLVGEDVRIRRRTSSRRVRDWVVCNETDLLGGGGGRRAMRQTSWEGKLGGVQ